jgi:NADPH-dependent F420 reductase
MTGPLKIALLSATGKEGPPLALRWALAGHHVLIGSRQVEKAQEVTYKLLNKLQGGDNKTKIEYGANTSVTLIADVIVPTMPYAALREALSGLKDFVIPNTIIICPVCPLKSSGGELITEKVPEGSVAELVAKSLPQALVTAAFHTVSAARLANLLEPVEGDVLVCSDHSEAKKSVMGLVSEIPNLHPVDGGALRNTCIVEELGSLVINIGRRIKKTDIGIKFV